MRGAPGNRRPYREGYDRIQGALFVMDLKSRRVHFAGCTTSPNETWMKQIARNLTAFDGFFAGGHYLLMDRDAKFTITS